MRMMAAKTGINSATRSITIAGAAMSNTTTRVIR